MHVSFQKFAGTVVTDDTIGFRGFVDIGPAEHSVGWYFARSSEHSEIIAKSCDQHIEKAKER